VSVVRVQAKGQMTVPETIRKSLDIATGTELVCMQTGPDAFECRVMPKPLSVDELIQRFGSPGVAPTPEEMQEIVREGMLAEAHATYDSASEG
jgi:bifunctional DNA-binding transcriptional regulator/antitoxin component of YhaV-PrlF toxin-antitoxin module